jgi:replicative DNA helicase
MALSVVPRQTQGAAPSNLEAEQGLLGALLYEAEAIHRLPPDFARSHFYEPVHGRLFAAIQNHDRIGLTPDAALIAEEFRRDLAFKELGGRAYLADLLDRAPPPSRCPDYARAIMATATRRAIIAYADELATAARDGEVEVDELVDQAERGLLDVRHVDPKMSLSTPQEVGQELREYVDNQGEAVGILTGLAPLDLQLGPLLPEDLILIAARPGMGKSMLAANLALRIAAPQFWRAADEGAFDSATGFRVADPAGVIIFNGEMSKAQMGRRLVANIGHHLFGKEFPTYSRIRSKKITTDQRQMLERAIEAFEEMPIRLMKRTGLKMATLRSIARRQAAEWGRAGIKVGAVIIDHVGLIVPEGRSSGRYEAQTEISMGCKTLADDLKCVVIALVQLSRAVEQRDDKRPVMSDLRDSGSWEQDADAILFPFREAEYARKEKEPDANKNSGMDHAEWERRRKSLWMEIDVPKLREGEAGGAAKLWTSMGHDAARGAEPELKGGLV